MADELDVKAYPFWNIWTVDPKTKKRVKWIGMITDPKTGFEWLDKQGKKREHYQINNVPPTYGPTPNPSVAVVATNSDPDDDYGAVTAGALPEKPKPKVPGYQERPYEGRSRQPRRAVAAPVAPKASRPKPKPSKEMAEAQREAKVLLDKHKADEAAEIEAEKRGND